MQDELARRSDWWQASLSRPVEKRNGLLSTGRSLQSRERVAKHQVSKGELTYREDHPSVVRAAGAGVGGLGVAYGLPRTRAGSGMVAYGAKRGNRASALEVGVNRSLRAMETVTEPLGPVGRKVLRHMGTTGRLIDVFKPSTRAAGVALGGAYLLGRSIPVNRPTYRPVVGAPQRGI